MMCGEPQCAAKERTGGEAALVAERRRYPRRNLYFPIRVHRKDAGPASRVEATCTVNVSAGGLYFLARREYPVGSSLKIEFEGSIPGGVFGFMLGCRYRAKVVHRSEFIGPGEVGRREVRRGVGVAFEEGAALPFPNEVRQHGGVSGLCGTAGAFPAGRTMWHGCERCRDR